LSYFKLENSETKPRNGKLNFDVALSMKDREETFSCDEEFKTINLLSRIAIEKYKKEILLYSFWCDSDCTPTFNNIRVDCPIFTAFKDNRLIHHKDSLLAMIK